MSIIDFKRIQFYSEKKFVNKFQLIFFRKKKLKLNFKKQTNGLTLFIFNLLQTIVIVFLHLSTFFFPFSLFAHKHLVD